MFPQLSLPRMSQHAACGLLQFWEGPSSSGQQLRWLRCSCPRGPSKTGFQLYPPTRQGGSGECWEHVRGHVCKGSLF